MAKTNHIQGTLTGPFNQPDRAYIVNDATLERVSVQIDVDTRDTDNTDYRTTYLRAGLGLALVSGEYIDYLDTTRDPCVAILDEDVDLLDEFDQAVTGPVVATVIIKGFIDSAHLNANVDAAGVVNLKAAGFMDKQDY